MTGLDIIVVGLPIFLSCAIIASSLLIIGNRERFIEIFNNVGLLPKYSEVSIFLISFTLVMLFILVPGVQIFIFKILSEEGILRGAMVNILIFIITGILISTYHVFFIGRKGKWQRIILLTFVVLVNFFIGFAAGLYLLRESKDYFLLIFPALNILYSYIILIASYITFKFINDYSLLANRDAKVHEAIFGSIIILIIFTISHFVFKNHPLITLSICIGYATTISEFLMRLFTSKNL